MLFLMTRLSWFVKFFLWAAERAKTFGIEIQVFISFQWNLSYFFILSSRISLCYLGVSFNSKVMYNFLSISQFCIFCCSRPTPTVTKIFILFYSTYILTVMHSLLTKYSFNDVKRGFKMYCKSFICNETIFRTKNYTGLELLIRN